jgi:hypothetical protein
MDEKNEQLNFQHKGKTGAYSIASLTQLHLSGREGDKFRAQLVNPRNQDGSRGDVSSELTFFVKDYMSKQSVFDALAKFDRLRDLQYPVPPTTRYFTDGRRHYMLLTDMTENGRYNVWSWSMGTTSDERKMLRDMAPTEFEILTLAQPLLQKAENDHVSFLADNYFLRRKKTGGPLEMSFVDITSVEFYPIPVKEANEEALQDFINATL